MELSTKQTNTSGMARIASSMLVPASLQAGLVTSYPSNIGSTDYTTVRIRGAHVV